MARVHKQREEISINDLLDATEDKPQYTLKQLGKIDELELIKLALSDEAVHRQVEFIYNAERALESYRHLMFDKMLDKKLFRTFLDHHCQVKFSEQEKEWLVNDLTNIYTFYFNSLELSLVGAVEE